MSDIGTESLVIRSTVGRKRPQEEPVRNGDTRNFRDPLSLLAGSPVERDKQQSIDAIVTQLNAIREEYRTHGSLGDVIGGNTLIHLKSKNQVFPLELIGDYNKKHSQGEAQWPIDPDSGIRMPLTFAKICPTGCDYKPLLTTHAADRIKFYLSIDPSNHSLVAQFTNELMEYVYADRLSLLVKNEDHTYDNPCLYTWHPIELSKILKNLHERYPNIWQSTPHFLQGTIHDVNPDHIGWVQEPLNHTELRLKPISHSGRMAILGSYLSDKEISTENYVTACGIAQVKPYAPWLVNPPGVS